MKNNDRNPFQIAQPEPAVAGGAPIAGDDPSLSPRERVERLVRSSEIFVFMKGNPTQPRCGFSANTVVMLESLGVSYSTFDILSDESIRNAAKEYAQWPTFPQVWFKGELIGGNDIVSEMYSTGELVGMLEQL